jgi:hypothetical protein
MVILSDTAEIPIQFLIDPQHQNDPPPIRTVQNMPTWLKQMQPSMEVSGIGTVFMLKTCAPFFDALSSGYTLPLRGPVRFAWKNDKDLEVVNLDFQGSGLAVDAQSELLHRGSPYSNNIVVKFLNYWVVKTPPGYSCLFLPVLNQYHLPFNVLAGVVDTDTYYVSVQFPSVCTLQPGMQVTLERGTPLVQVIPFKREIWKAQIGSQDPQLAQAALEETARNKHHYREQNWVKKDFR